MSVNERRKPGNPNWKKGTSGNPYGRPVGSRNKTSEQIRQYIKEIISGEMDNLNNDLTNMNDFQRWLIIDKLARYFMPTLSKAEIDQKNTTPIKIEVTYEDKPPVEDKEGE